MAEGQLKCRRGGC